MVARVACSLRSDPKTQKARDRCLEWLRWNQHLKTSLALFINTLVLHCSGLALKLSLTMITRAIITASVGFHAILQSPPQTKTWLPFPDAVGKACSTHTRVSSLFKAVTRLSDPSKRKTLKDGSASCRCKKNSRIISWRKVAVSNPFLNGNLSKP